MSILRNFSRLMILVGALVASSQAQLMHLSLTEPVGNGGLIFRASSAQIPWNQSGGYISRFDLWYDLDNPSDPSRNLWRMNVRSYELGDFEIIRSHDSLTFNEFEEGALFVDLLHLVSNPKEQLSLRFSIWDDDTPDPNLPFPQYNVADIDLRFEAGRSFFDVPNLNGGSGSGAFNRATFGTAQSVDLTPVPEPSTYALFAVMGLGVAAFLRRRREARGRSNHPAAS